MRGASAVRERPVKHRPRFDGQTDTISMCALVTSTAAWRKRLNQKSHGKRGRNVAFLCLQLSFRQYAGINYAIMLIRSQTQHKKMVIHTVELQNARKNQLKSVFWSLTVMLLCVRNDPNLKEVLVSIHLQINSICVDSNQEYKYL